MTGRNWCKSLVDLLGLRSAFFVCTNRLGLEKKLDYLYSRPLKKYIPARHFSNRVSR